MADLTSVSLSDLVAALKERCSTPTDIQAVMNKLDIMANSAEAGRDSLAKDLCDTSRDACENRAAIFNRIGDAERALTNDHRDLADNVKVAQDILSREHSDQLRQLGDARQESIENRAAIFNRIGDTESRVVSGERDLQRDILNNREALGAAIASAKDQACNFAHMASDDASQIRKDVSDGTSRAVEAVGGAAGGLGDAIDRTKDYLGSKLSQMASDAASCCCETKLGMERNTNLLDRNILMTSERTNHNIDKSSCNTDKEILKTGMFMDARIDKMEHRIEREVERHGNRLERAQDLGFAALSRENCNMEKLILQTSAQAAKEAALCCCETKNLILETKNEVKEQATANYNALGMQATANYNGIISKLCDMQYAMDKGFASVKLDSVERELAAKGAALLAAQNEISNQKQTQQILEQLRRECGGDRRG